MFMRKLKLLMMACALLGAGQVWADDVFMDITSGKITNPSFESDNKTISDSESKDPLTAGWKYSQSNGRAAIYNSSSTTNMTYGASSASAGSFFLRIRSAGSDNVTGTSTVQLKSPFSLDKGTYRISFDYKAAQPGSTDRTFTVYAKNGSTDLGSKENAIPNVSANTSYFSTGGGKDWTTDNLSFTLESTTSVTLEIRCLTKKYSSGHTTLLLDNFILERNLTQSLKDLLSEANDFYATEGSSYSALKTVIDATNTGETDPDELEEQYNALAAALDLAKNHRKPWLDAKAAAQAAIEDANYGNVTGEEKTNLQSAIAADEPSNADGYDSAKSNLESKTSTFTGAKANYDKYAAEADNASALGVDPIPALDVASNYSDKLKALIVLEDAAVTTGFTQDITARVVDSWSTSNADKKTDAEHWSGESRTYYNRYQESGFTMYAKKTVSLPAGTYVLKAAARCDKRNEEVGYYLGVTVDGVQTKELYTSTSGATGKGIATNGNANYTDGTFANEGSGYGWEWRFVGFTLEETKEVELKISANILAKGWVSFSDIQLLTTSATEKNVLIKLLNEEITAAKGIDNTTNVGSDAFQIPSSAAEALDDAITAAQGIYDASASKSSSELGVAIDNLKSAETTFAAAELNAPTVGKRYQIVNVTSASSFDYSGKALTFYENPAQTEGGYGYQYRLDPNVNYAQGFIFTAVDGQKNVYTLSYVGLDGATRYLCSQYGYNENASGDKERIRTTTDPDYALKVRVDVTTTANVWKLYNTEANKYIGTNAKSNNDFFTNANRSDIKIQEVEQASVSMTIPSDVKLATRIFPFIPVLPSGVKAYSCEAAADDVLTLVEVAKPQANTPYILYAEGGYSGDALTGYGTADDDNYTDGWLTGVYTETEAPEGSYVLQKQGDEVAFYQVDKSVVTPSVGAYRCYLTTSAPARALYINFDETTAVETIKALTSGKSTIYNAAGAVVPSLQKGMNIIKMSDGSIRKVMVK